MSSRRYFQNRDQRERDRRNLSNARYALENFRKTGDVSGFPELRIYLAGKHIGMGNFRNFSLSGFHQEDLRPPLTQVEYDRMKVAWKETPEGQKDNWYDDRW